MMVDALGQFFVNPLPLSGFIKAVLILPLCLSISIVYKATRMDDLSRLRPAVAGLCLTIVVGMYAVGLGLWLMFQLFS